MGHYNSYRMHLKLASTPTPHTPLKLKKHVQVGKASVVSPFGLNPTPPIRSYRPVDLPVGMVRGRYRAGLLVVSPFGRTIGSCCSVEGASTAQCPQCRAGVFLTLLRVAVPPELGFLPWTTIC